MGKHTQRITNQKEPIDKEWYAALGADFYSKNDHPVALFRALHEARLPWILSIIDGYFGKKVKVLDLGTKGGLLANALAERGHIVIGVDPKEELLEFARKRDSTQSVQYFRSDFAHLPFPNQSFDLVFALDLLEYEEDPEKIVQLASRLLCHRGLYIFQTINRTSLASFAIKALPFLVKNTPKNFQSSDLCVTPKELFDMCLKANLAMRYCVGFTPQIFSSSFMKMLFTRKVPVDFRFKRCHSLALTYAGYAVKEDLTVPFRRPAFLQESRFAHDAS